MVNEELATYHSDGVETQCDTAHGQGSNLGYVSLGNSEDQTDRESRKNLAAQELNRVLGDKIHGSPRHCACQPASMTSFPPIWDANTFLAGWVVSGRAVVRLRRRQLTGRQAWLSTPIN